ncbi:MAG: hypothetical protein Q4C00_04785, partial [Bacillota bacterium]|nr:hypothetical protein [Bacillota bacterium]
MDWEFRNEFDTKSLKDVKNWFELRYYLMPLVPVLAGSFAGAFGGELRFFTLILLVLTVLLGRTAISALAALRQGGGEEIIYYKYFFEEMKLPLGLGGVRFAAAVSSLLTLIFGFVLCLVCGFGLLVFALLSAASAWLFMSGYCRERSWLLPFLAFFGQGFVLTAVAYYSQSGMFHPGVFALSLPLAFILAALAIYTAYDARAAILGMSKENFILALIFLAFVFVVLNALYGVSGFWCLLLFLSIYFLKKDMVT